MECSSCVAPEMSGPQEIEFESVTVFFRSFRKDAIAGQGRMDFGPGRTRVHEHAETGRPFAASRLHRMRGIIGQGFPQPHFAEGQCKRQRWNGPASNIGVVGHKLSAIGLPQRAAGAVGQPSRLAALRGRREQVNRQISDSRVIPSAHSLSSRCR